MLYLITKFVLSVDSSSNKNIAIFLISFLSNTFSAISGGGAGLLQLPGLILFGIPYHQALASHKLATVALGIGGSLRNYKSLRNDIWVAWQILIFGLPGVIFGAYNCLYIRTISILNFSHNFNIFSILLSSYTRIGFIIWKY